MQHSLLLNTFGFFSWRDGIEIILISGMIYIFMLWLKKDIYKNLLGYFYSYCILAFSAYCLQLSIITYIMCACWPAMLMVFIMIHQISLQKNFVALRPYLPPQQATSEWLNTLIRSSLLAMNNHKEVRCIIQRTDTLDPLVELGVPVNATITHDLLSMLIDSSSYSSEQMLWLTAEGTLLSINAGWNPVLDEHWLAPEQSDMHIWEHHAVLVTARNDAIAIRTNPKTQTYTVIVQGTIKTQINANTALQYLATYLHSTDQVKGNMNYATNYKKSSIEQHNS